MMRTIALLAMSMFSVGAVAAGEPPSRPGIDAPELAHLGSFAVGVKTLHLVQHAQIDILATMPPRDPRRRRIVHSPWIFGIRLIPNRVPYRKHTPEVFRRNRRRPPRVFRFPAWRFAERLPRVRSTLW